TVKGSTIGIVTVHPGGPCRPQSRPAQIGALWRCTTTKSLYEGAGPDVTGARARAAIARARNSSPSESLRECITIGARRLPRHAYNQPTASPTGKYSATMPQVIGCDHLYRL